MVRMLSSETANDLSEPRHNEQSQAFLNASVILIRIAPIAGAKPAKTPSATMSQMPVIRSRLGSSKNPGDRRSDRRAGR